MGKGNKARSRSLYLTDKLMDELGEILETKPRDFSMSRLVEELLQVGLEEYRKKQSNK